MTALAQALQHLPQLQTLDLMCALAMAQLASSSPVYEFRWASMPCMQGYARTDTAERLDITRTLAEHAPATRVSARARVSTALAAQSG
jgi:hypothetical protein